jgi:hypothetical protein
MGRICSKGPWSHAPTVPHKGRASCVGQLRRRRSARCDAHNRRREPVAATRYGLDDGLVGIANGFAHFAHAMCQRLVRHVHVGPDSLKQLLPGHEAIGILQEIAQQLEALRAQRNLAIHGSQHIARDIQRISLELEHLGAAP